MRIPVSRVRFELLCVDAIACGFTESRLVFIVLPVVVELAVISFTTHIATGFNC